MISFGRPISRKRLEFLDGLRRLIAWLFRLLEFCIIKLPFVLALSVGLSMRALFTLLCLAPRLMHFAGIERRLEFARRRGFQLFSDLLLIFLD